MGQAHRRRRLGRGRTDASIVARHTDTGIPVVQIGTEMHYLATVEAELTRVTGPDPDAWLHARHEAFWAFWAFWRHYVEVREIGARFAVGERVGESASRLRERLARLGAVGMVDVVDGGVD